MAIFKTAKKAIENRIQAPEKARQGLGEMIKKGQEGRQYRKNLKAESKARARERKVELKYAPQVEGASAQIDQTAEQTGQTPQEVAKKIIKNPITQQQYKGYLQRKGKSLSEEATPEAVAVQTYQTYLEDVDNRRNQALQEQANQTGEEPEEEDVTFEEAEEEILEEEFLGRERANFSGVDEPNNFLSAAAVAAIAKGAPVLVDAVNTQRVKKGKKPLPTIDEIISKTGTGDPTAIKKATDAAQEEYIAQKKKEEIKKMLPAIIGGTILLILVVIAITYYSAHE